MRKHRYLFLDVITDRRIRTQRLNYVFINQPGIFFIRSSLNMYLVGQTSLNVVETTAETTGNETGATWTSLTNVSTGIGLRIATVKLGAVVPRLVATNIRLGEKASTPTNSGTTGHAVDTTTVVSGTMTAGVGDKSPGIGVTTIVLRAKGPAPTGQGTI